MSSYVYIYLDPRKSGKFYYQGLDMCFLYQPLYIGKGTGERYRKHLYESSLNDEPHTLKNRKLRKILNLGLKPFIVKIKEELTDKEAFLYEQYIIELIGKIIDSRGPLANIADGGESFNSNSIPWNKGKKMTNEYRINLSKKLSLDKNRRINSLSKMGINNPMYISISNEITQQFIIKYNNGETFTKIMNDLKLGRKLFYRLRKENKNLLKSTHDIKQVELKRIKQKSKKYIINNGLYGLIAHLMKEESKSRPYILKQLRILEIKENK